MLLYLILLHSTPQGRPQMKRYFLFGKKNYLSAFLDGIAEVLSMMPMDDAKYFIDKLEKDDRISEDDAQKLRYNRGIC